MTIPRDKIVLIVLLTLGILGAILLSLPVIFVIVYLFIAQPIQVVGHAMDPAYLHGQYYLINKLAYRAEIPKRGDAIVFHRPVPPEALQIGRIVGLPGEILEIHDGKIDRLGEEGDTLIEPYLPTGVMTRGGKALKEDVGFAIPTDQYMVLGDNRDRRDRSSDSREFGFVPKENILGKLSFCYWHCSQ